MLRIILQRLNAVTVAGTKDGIKVTHPAVADLNTISHEDDIFSAEGYTLFGLLGKHSCMNSIELICEVDKRHSYVGRISEYIVLSKILILSFTSTSKEYNFTKYTELFLRFYINLNKILS